MGKQAVIYFKNGTKDWVDPIDDESTDVFYGNSVIIIRNGANNKYVYDKFSVEKIEFIELDDVK